MVRPRIAMSACVEAFAAPEIIDDFYSTAIQAKSVAQKWVSVNMKFNLSFVGSHL